MLITGLAAIILHFTMLLIYCNPFPTGKNKAYYYSYYYTYPFFAQSWTLFTPAPNCNYKLFASFEKNGIHKTDVLQDIMFRHQSNRLAGYEPIVLSIANTIHYFEKSTPLQKPVNGPVLNDKNFDILLFSSRRYLENLYGGKVNNLKLMLVVEPVNGEPVRIYFNEPV